MNRWVARLIDPALSAGCVVVLLDPDGWLDPSGVPNAELAAANDWWTLRQIWEREGRYRGADTRPLVIVITDAVFAGLRLPWDISSSATCVRIRPPVDASLTPLLHEVPENRLDAVVDSLEKGATDPVGTVLAQGWFLALPADPTGVAELEAVARLLDDPTVGPETWRAVRERIRTPLAAALSTEPPDPRPLQQAWNDWTSRGEASETHDTLSAAGRHLMPLFEMGLLEPGSPGASLPAWARALARPADLIDEARSLLAHAPAEPGDTAGWLELAAWWGRVRALIAEAPQERTLQDEADAWWLGIDAAFATWLREGALASAMTSASATWPATVASIGPFLARRMRAGTTRRLLLVVVDGMGWAQWELIKSASAFSVLQERGTLAMVPTLTSVSRQSILAGQLPLHFADSLAGTGQERARWQSLWHRELGDNVPPAWYTKTVGRFPRDIPDLNGAEVSAVVVNAVDELMHGAVMGDRQLALDVRSWAQHGFLDALVATATDDGYEVWITADHGNVEALPLGNPKFEGLAVEHSGSRVRWYATPDLAEASSADGVYWPNPPGLPNDRCFALFAPGRGGFFGSGLRMAHGGLSVDEVVVPLAQVIR